MGGWNGGKTLPLPGVATATAFVVKTLPLPGVATATATATWLEDTAFRCGLAGGALVEQHGSRGGFGHTAGGLGGAGPAAGRWACPPALGQHPSVRHYLCLVCSAAFVAKTVPFLVVLRWYDMPSVSPATLVVPTTTVGPAAGAESAGPAPLPTVLVSTNPAPFRLQARAGALLAAKAGPSLVGQGITAERVGTVMEYRRRHRCRLSLVLSPPFTARSLSSHRRRHRQAVHGAGRVLAYLPEYGHRHVVGFHAAGQETARRKVRAATVRGAAALLRWRVAARVCVAGLRAAVCSGDQRRLHRPTQRRTLVFSGGRPTA